MRLVRPLLFVAAMLAAVLLPAGSALALSYPVTSTADTKDKGTLRASIKEANDRIGADSIPIEVTGTIKLESKLPGIGGNVTITGPGAGSLTVARSNSAPFFGVLEISGPTSTVSGITVRGGVAATGAGIINSGDLTLIRVVVTGNQAASEGMYASGGGIFNSGSLTLRESTVSGNKAIAGDADENIAEGGGVASEGSLLVERSTIGGNLAWAFAGIGHKSEAIGGGLALASGIATVEESTISGNTVLAEESSENIIARGGGIWGSGLTIRGSTIAGNAAEIDESATFRNVAGDNVDVGAVIRDSIVADPQGNGGSCANPLISGGFNLDEDGSCGFGKSSDLVSVVASLEPLGDNGGPTPTRALRADSIAIDRGNSFNYSLDQRGLPRISEFVSISNTEGGDGSDIGAFELQVPATPPDGPVLVSAVPSDTTPPNTRIVSGPPRNTYKRLAKFRFASTEAQSSFQCKLDKKKWRSCGNPFKRSVKPGKHVFQVRAIDRFGNVDPKPARFGWRVKPLS
jgi:large repetitive protein